MYEAFLKEKQYLLNVSPRTLEWYRQALNWLNEDNGERANQDASDVSRLGLRRRERPNRLQEADAFPERLLQPTSEANLKAVVIRMRESGLSARSINSYRTAINSYLHWLTGSDKACSPQCPHSRIPKMKCEQRVLPVFSAADIQTVMRWKPKKRCDRRLQAIMLTLADTGCRIDEVLSLTWADVDFDNLLITVTGKGNKQRRIPFSFELRKILWNHYADTQRQWQRDTPGQSEGARYNFAGLQGRRSINGGLSCRSEASPINGSFQHVFCTQGTSGNKLGRRNILRDVKRTCTKLGIQYPERTLHALRHTFAINYLRRGGSVFHLQKVLGHTDLTMTRRYANLMTEDLSLLHERVSLLSGTPAR